MGVTKIKITRSSRTSNDSSANNNIIKRFLCFLTALFLSLSWIVLPFFEAFSSVSSVFFSSLSQTTNYSINFPTPTWVFILGNLIVVVLIGESKILVSEKSDGFGNGVCFDDGNFAENLTGDGEREENRGLEKCDEEDEDDDLVNNNCEELSKRADDFIARVNMQRENEAMMLTYYSCEFSTMKKKYRNKGLKGL